METNKCSSIVFSYWRESLDMMSFALDRSGVKYVRVDGTMTAKQRRNELSKFKLDRRVRILLFTFSTGAAGYAEVLPGTFSAPLVD